MKSIQSINLIQSISDLSLKIRKVDENSPSQSFSVEPPGGHGTSKLTGGYGAGAMRHATPGATESMARGATGLGIYRSTGAASDPWFTERFQGPLVVVNHETIGKPWDNHRKMMVEFGKCPILKVLNIT